MEKLDVLALKVKINGQETDLSNESTELKQKEDTEQSSPPGWSAATGTLYTLCTGNIMGNCTLSRPPSRGGGGGAGGARGMDWAADPWVDSIT